VLLLQLWAGKPEKLNVGPMWQLCCCMHLNSKNNYIGSDAGSAVATGSSLDTSPCVIRYVYNGEGMQCQ